VLHDHSVATTVKAFQYSHKVMHRQLKTSFSQEFLEFLVVDETVVLAVNQVKQVLGFMFSKLTADL
jgi:hypothetical protein